MLARIDTTTDMTAQLARRGYAIVDDLVNDEHRQVINNMLHAGGWAFGWKSDAKKDTYAFWHRHFGGNTNPDNYDLGGAEKPYECADEVRRNAPDIFALWSVLSATMLPGHKLVRCYANGAPFGSEGSVHTDSKAPNSYTTIFYPNRTWHPNWGGETVLFTQDEKDILAAIYPRPNRFMTFRGTMPHVARGVSRTCPVLRVTLMFKTETNHDE